MVRTSLLFSLLAMTVLLSACNNRSRGSTTTDPLCPGTVVSTGDFCDEGQAGITCSGTVSCPCGQRSTSCVCVMGAAGYGFECVDSCSCPTRDGGSGSAQCAAVFDRMQASPCPFPPDSVDRASFVAQCGAAGGGSAMCQAELDAFLACALSAPIVCEELGEGVRFPTIPSCGQPSESCLN